MGGGLSVSVEALRREAEDSSVTAGSHRETWLVLTTVGCGERGSKQNK